MIFWLWWAAISCVHVQWLERITRCRKGRDRQKKKIGKANEEKKKGKSNKEQKMRSEWTRGKKGGERGCPSPMWAATNQPVPWMSPIGQVYPQLAAAHGTEYSAISHATTVCQRTLPNRNSKRISLDNNKHSPVPLWCPNLWQTWVVWSSRRYPTLGIRSIPRSHQ